MTSRRVPPTPLLAACLGFVFALFVGASTTAAAFSTEYRDPVTGYTRPAPTPRDFSFYSPHGACPACTGLGTKLIVEPDLVIPNPRLTLAQGAIKPWTRIAGNQQWYNDVLGFRIMAKTILDEAPISVFSVAFVLLRLSDVAASAMRENGGTT